MDITFHHFDPNTSLKQHQALFAASFPEVYYHDPLYPEAYEEMFLHEYHKFPGTPTSYQYKAADGNEMIGYYAALPYRYKIGKKTVTSGMVCGVMTSPEYRKAGIFTRLGNYAAEQQAASGVAFNLTFPIRKAVMPGFMRMGWDQVFEMPLYIRFIKLTSLLISKKMGFLAWLANPLVSLFNFILHRSNNSGFEIRIFQKPDEITGYEDFYRRWSAMVPNCLVKDRAFMQWRYGFPHRNYFFVCAYRDGKLCGLMAARPIIRENVPSFGILDFMVTDVKCTANLHNAVYRLAKSEKKEAIMMMMSKYSAGKYQLIRNSFLKSPFRFHLIIKNLSGEFSNDILYDEKSWHLMFVDSDDL